MPKIRIRTLRPHRGEPAGRIAWVSEDLFVVMQRNGFAERYQPGDDEPSSSTILNVDETRRAAAELSRVVRAAGVSIADFGRNAHKASKEFDNMSGILNNMELPIEPEPEPERKRPKRLVKLDKVLKLHNKND